MAGYVTARAAIAAAQPAGGGGGILHQGASLLITLPPTRVRQVDPQVGGEKAFPKHGCPPVLSSPTFYIDVSFLL